MTDLLLLLAVLLLCCPVAALALHDAARRVGRRGACVTR